MLYLDPPSFVLTSSFAKIYCEPGWRWQKSEKAIENYELFYVWSGEGKVQLGSETYPAGKGSCFLFRPGDHPTAEHNPEKPLVITYIHFNVSAPVTEVPNRYRLLHDPIDFELLLSRYVRLFLVRTFAAETEAGLILKQLMVQLLRHDRETPTRRKLSNQLMESIQEAANYIRQHPGLPHRVSDLAARAGLSPRYFTAKFKEQIGQSVQSYITRCRMERARHLLTHAGMSVSEVAGALGYHDIFYFSRQFKQHTGKSPSEVR
jgi:AraC-like DNA-binding protein